MISDAVLEVRPTEPVLKPDRWRVLFRPFVPGNEARTRGIISRIMQIQEFQVGPLLEEMSREFSHRHPQIQQIFQERFGQVPRWPGSRRSRPTRDGFR